jgi:endoglucanase
MIHRLPPISRRDFVKTMSLALTASSAPGLLGASSQPVSIPNAIPKWRGFNLLDYFWPQHGGSPYKSTEEDFMWMRDWGFDFVRLPMAYPSYLKIDRTRNITPDEVYHFDEEVLEQIDKLVEQAHRCGLHVSLNLHRAPGYCINAGFHEPYNLWLDDEAQQAFNFHWEMWAERYKGFSSKLISFDLVNEPAMREDMNDQHAQATPVPGHLYRRVAKGAAEAIRGVNPDHLVIADGNFIGNYVIPEIVDLNIAQSCRGYFPHAISHYQAPWANKYPEKNPVPVWPGTIGDTTYSRKDLEEYYQPWIDLKNQGVGVHCGECGCWIRTPHDVFLAWFEDVLDILTSQGIGWGLWNFRGEFGLMDSKRKDVVYEDWHGHQLDRKLLQLLQRY